MRIADRFSVVLFLLALFAIARPAAAQSPASQPVVLVPATAPAAGPTNSGYRYPDSGQYRYSDAAVTTYGPAPASYPAPTQFAPGDFELSLGGQGFTARGDRGDESIGFITFDAGWFFVPTLSVDFELGVAPGTYRDRYHYDHHSDDDGVRAVEEMALLRWHFLTLGGLSLYADGGVGGMYASPDFPSDGRRNNFLAAVGGGVTLQVVSHFYLGAGARAAWLDGGDWDLDRHQHHWSDGVQYYGDLTFIFP